MSGLTVLAALRTAGMVPERDLTVVDIRAEEASSWFDGSHAGHFGSRAALGLLSPSELDDASSRANGRSLATQLAHGGFDPDLIRSGRASLSAAAFRGFIELHIEQGHEAEAIVLSCTDLQTFGVVEALERDLGKPVVSANLDTLWAMLGSFEASQRPCRIKGFGVQFDRRVGHEHAGAAAKCLLGVPKVQRAVGPQEEARFSGSGSQQHGLPMLLSLQHRDAVVVRTDATLEQRIAILTDMEPPGLRMLRGR